MIRLIATFVLCLGVSTLGFARLCVCDHQGAESHMQQPAADHGDCPHTGQREATPDQAPEDDHPCQHCAACVLTSAMPLPAVQVLDETPVHTDFSMAVTSPHQGSPSLPLRPPIT
jgi:hypothetical protein